MRAAREQRGHGNREREASGYLHGQPPSTGDGWALSDGSWAVKANRDAEAPFDRLARSLLGALQSVE
jgi:hypothetical protein